MSTFTIANLGDLPITGAVTVPSATPVVISASAGQGLYILVTSALGAAITLPSVGMNQGATFIVADRAGTAAAHNIVISWTGAGSPFTINTNNGTVILVWDGLTYFQVA